VETSNGPRPYITGPQLKISLCGLCATRSAITHRPWRRLARGPQRGSRSSSPATGGGKLASDAGQKIITGATATAGEPKGPKPHSQATPQKIAVRSRQEPERARLADLKRAFEVRSTHGGRIWWIEPATPVSSAQGKAYFR
jgi:hypothetical protein